jgi:hypothetical protein
MNDPVLVHSVENSYLPTLRDLADGSLFGFGNASETPCFPFAINHRYQTPYWSVLAATSLSPRP